MKTKKLLCLLCFFSIALSACGNISEFEENPAAQAETAASDENGEISALEGMWMDDAGNYFVILPASSQIYKVVASVTGEHEGYELSELLSVFDTDPGTQNVTKEGENFFVYLNTSEDKTTLMIMDTERNYWLSILHDQHIPVSINGEQITWNNEEGEQTFLYTVEDDTGTVTSPENETRNVTRVQEYQSIPQYIMEYLQ